MEGLLQPLHLFFILAIAIILFGPGDTRQFAQRLRRSFSDLQGVPSSFRRTLFMAKGVDPSVGRDVGDMLPDESLRRNETWHLVLLAILIGNTLYLLSSPILPEAARMHRGPSSALPGLVDLWIYFLVYGALNLVRLVGNQDRKKR